MMDVDDHSPELAFDTATVECIGETAFFQTIIENTSDGVLTIDETSTIVCANSAVERIFGYSADELIGTSLLTLIPEQLQDQHLHAIRRYIETGDRNLSWNYIELPGLHKDGHEVELSISLREIEHQGQHLFTGTIREITERKQQERQVERYNTIVEAVGDGVYQLDLEGRFVTVNEVIAEFTGYSQDELIGKPVSMVLNDEDIAKSLAVIQELLTTDDKDVGVVKLNAQTADGEVVPIEDRIALLRSGGEMQGTVGVVRDISERMQREQQLERQRNELAELNRINAVIRDVNQTLVSATTREDIEETVCERLAGSTSYLFVWIGERRPGSRKARPREWAGVDEDYLDEVIITADGTPTGQGPTGKALRTQESQVAQDILHNPEFEPWREYAVEHGFQSSIAIPLRHGDTIYGILSIYSDRPFGFDERERTVLEELGETIGLAINAVESKKLLYADTVDRLKFHVTDPTSFFIKASQKLECTIQLEGVVPAEESTFLYYMTVKDAASDSILELVGPSAKIRDASVISEHDGESLILFEVTGASAIITLIEAGARIKTAYTVNGDGVITVEIAPGADTSTIAETVTRVFPESELVAQSEIEHPVQTKREFREVVKDRLTDKQRTALEAAYRGGYFARPRDISGNDLAESFGVTPSTYHQHLQTALNKVVGTVFDESR